MEIGIWVRKLWQKLKRENWYDRWLEKWLGSEKSRLSLSRKHHFTVGKNKSRESHPRSQVSVLLRGPSEREPWEWGWWRLVVLRLGVIKKWTTESAVLCNQSKITWSVRNGNANTPGCITVLFGMWKSYRFFSFSLTQNVWAGQLNHWGLNVLKSLVKYIYIKYYAYLRQAKC